jgi:hypothetical protein
MYRLADDAAGKAIKCQKCGAHVSVPAVSVAKAKPVATGQTANSSAKNGDRSKAKQTSGSRKIIMIGAGILAGACCLCTGIGSGTAYWIYLASRRALDDFQKDLAKFDRDLKGAGGTTILEKKETLTDKDPRVANGKSAKAYKVKLEVGKHYVIDLKADNKFGGGDPYLYLLDPQGKEVAHDDDGGGFPDAQIRYSPAVTGEFTIQATALSGPPPAGMPFTLSVKAEK